jgi:hypothetical protein
VITGVADRIPERLAQLVYLDAEVPMDGQSELDLLPPDERAGYEKAARSKGQGWQIPPPLPEPLPDDLDPRVRWAMVRMVPQPLATFAQPLRLTNPGAHRCPAPMCCAQQARKTKSCSGTSSAPDRSRGGDSSSSRPGTAPT